MYPRRVSQSPWKGPLTSSFPASTFQMPNTDTCGLCGAGDGTHAHQANTL